MKSLSEMIEPRQDVITLVAVRALPYSNMSIIDSDYEDDWELAVKSGIVNYPTHEGVWLSLNNSLPD